MLLGRGYLGHYGNMLFRQLIDEHSAEYESTAQRWQKTRLAKIVVDKIKDGGGRFLKKGPKGGWVVVTDEVAREKVSHRFRQVRNLVSANDGNSSSNNRISNQARSGGSMCGGETVPSFPRSRKNAKGSMAGRPSTSSNRKRDRQHENDLNSDCFLGLTNLCGGDGGGIFCNPISRRRVNSDNTGSSY